MCPRRHRYKVADVSKDGMVQRGEFRMLLRHIDYFNRMWDKFEQIDADGGRLDVPRKRVWFIHGAPLYSTRKIGF